MDPTTKKSLSVKYLVFLVLLSGCASQEVKEFIPYTPENHSQTGVYADDLSTCRKYALDYLSQRSSVNPSQVAQEGLSGGIHQLPSITLSPLTPALGAISGASTETLSELGLNAQEAKKIVSWCMHDKGLLHDYSIFDPNL